MGPRGAGERGRPLFSPFQSARASLRPFVFDPLVSQEEEARLSAFCSRTRTLRGHASPCLQGRPGVQGGPTPAARLSPPGDLGGGPREACRQLRPWLGVTSTFPRRTDCPRAQCFRSGIPVLGPAAAHRDRECPVPAGKLRAGPAGLLGPLPCQSRLPGGWGRGRGGEGGVDNQVATCRALPRGFHLFIPVSLLPTVVTPFSEILG